MKKRFLTTALCAAMLTGALATPVAAEKMVTVSLYIPSLATYSEEAIAQTEAVMNEHLAEKYGIQVDLQYIEIGNFEQSINLAMTTDELDVTCYFNEFGKLANYANNGQLLDITDYFNNASEEFKTMFTEAELSASKVNDRMYGVVRKYQYGGKEVAVMNKDIVEEMGIDPASITDMESLGEVLYKVHEAYPDMWTLVPQSSADMTWCQSWGKAVGGASFLYTDSPRDTELKSVFESKGFQDFCSYTNKWYNDGLIMSDAISNTMEGSDLVGAGTAFACLHNADIDPLDKLYPNTVVSGDIIAPMAQATDIGNLQYGISSNSAHPDEAFKLLEAIYTDEELIPTLMYGVEGEHWVYNEDGRAALPEGVTTENAPYGGFVASATYPNYTLAPLKDSAVVDDYKAALDSWNESVEVPPYFGWSFDTTKYTDFVTAYANMEEKYFDAVTTGSIPLEDVLPNIQSELESIGFYEIMEEAQTQLDAFLAEK
ncbi:MAG: ABC transporter substrate-binding protein [Eubacteriales bacterium]|nr:ABC transporter substrate-binding protein [Eubacteriales bacterium]